MKISKKDFNRLKALRDLVVFKWLCLNRTKSGIYLTDRAFDLRLQEGRFYFGQALKVGPLVKEIKPGDIFIFHEYSTVPFEGTLKEDQIYFIKEKSIYCKILDFEYLDALSLERLMTEDERDHLLNK